MMHWLRKLAIGSGVVMFLAIAFGAIYLYQRAEPRSAVALVDVCAFESLDLEKARQQYEMIAKSGLQKVSIGSVDIHVPTGLLPIALRSPSINTSGLLLQLKLPNFLPNLTAKGIYNFNIVHPAMSPVLKINLSEKRRRYIGHDAMLARYKLTSADGFNGLFGLTEFRVPDGVTASARSLSNYNFEDGSRLFLWCGAWELPAPHCRTLFTDHDNLDVFYVYKRVHLCNWRKIHEQVIWLVEKFEVTRNVDNSGGTNSGTPGRKY